MIVRTGKFLEADVAEQLRKLHLSAQTTPAILLSQRSLGPYGKTESELAWNRFNDAMDAAAVGTGLPPPRTITDDDGDLATVNYGCDFATGEVLGWEPDAKETK